MASPVLASRNALASVAVLLVLTISGGVEGVRFKVQLHNNCHYPVWPAWVPTNGTKPSLCPGGTSLKPYETYDVYPSTGWSGHFWGRTGCNFTAGHGPCETGGCGSIGCRALGRVPITLATFRTDSKSSSTLRYEVSLLHGFNVPVRIEAHSALPSCGVLQCPCDAVVEQCPQNLTFTTTGGRRVGCYSPCDRFGDDQSCCRGSFSENCQPNDDSKFFKSICHGAITYPKDFNNTSVTCGISAVYTVTFCPDEDTPTLRRAAI